MLDVQICNVPVVANVNSFQGFAQSTSQEMAAGTYSMTVHGMAEWVIWRQGPSSRFGNKLISDFELKMSKGFVPKSTEKSTVWAVRNFQPWCGWREKQRNPVPKDLLDCSNGEMLNR